MDTTKRSSLDRLLFATFLKGRTSSRDLWEEKGDMTPEDNQTCLQNPSPPMMLSRNCTTASTKLPPHWGTTAPMCSVRSLQNWSRSRKKSRPLTVCWRWPRNWRQSTEITLRGDFNELRMGNCFHFSGMVCRTCGWCKCAGRRPRFTNSASCHRDGVLRYEVHKGQ